MNTAVFMKDGSVLDIEFSVDSSEETFDSPGYFEIELDQVIDQDGNDLTRTINIEDKAFCLEEIGKKIIRGDFNYDE